MRVCQVSACERQAVAGEDWRSPGLLPISSRRVGAELTLTVHDIAVVLVLCEDHARELSHVGWQAMLGVLDSWGWSPRSIREAEPPIGQAPASRSAEDRLLTVDEAYRAAFHFVLQYYKREPIVPFLLLLHSMTPWLQGDDPRSTSDPATWGDWLASVEAACSSDVLPPLEAPES